MLKEENVKERAFRPHLAVVRVRAKIGYADPNPTVTKQNQSRMLEI